MEAGRPVSWGRREQSRVGLKKAGVKLVWGVKDGTEWVGHWSSINLVRLGGGEEAPLRMAEAALGWCDSRDVVS